MPMTNYIQKQLQIQKKLLISNFIQNKLEIDLFINNDVKSVILLYCNDLCKRCEVCNNPVIFLNTPCFQCNKQACNACFIENIVTSFNHQTRGLHHYCLDCCARCHFCDEFRLKTDNLYRCFSCDQYLCFHHETVQNHCYTNKSTGEKICICSYCENICDYNIFLPETYDFVCTTGCFVCEKIDLFIIYPLYQNVRLKKTIHICWNCHNHCKENINNRSYKNQLLFQY